MEKIVIISGSIGAGKTTLIEKMTEKIQSHAQVHYETVDDNPYLSDFYTNPHSYAYKMQIFMLFTRLSTYQKICTYNQNAIHLLDRGVYEDYIFAQSAYENGFIDKIDFESYKKVYDTICALIKPPDLIILVNTPPTLCMERIKNRNRNAETTIPQTYLNQLDKAYNIFYKNWTICPIITLDGTQTVDKLCTTAIQAFNF